MKTPLLILLVLLSQLAVAQSDSCATGKAHAFHQFFRSQPDTTVYPVTDSLTDDTSAYPQRKKGSTERIVFFVHGLGGDGGSWIPADNGLADEFVYIPDRPDYSGSQESWSSSAHALDDEISNKVNNEKSTRNDHYVIAHSMGGVLCRELDYIYENNKGKDPKPRPGFERNFYGLVTLGSPHAGAPIIANQEQVIKLFQGGCDVMLNAKLVDVITDLQLKHPIIMALIGDEAIQSAYGLVNTVCDHLYNQATSYVLHDFTVGTAYAIHPDSPAINYLGAFSNPELPKVAMYGSETAPVIWRVLHNVLVKSPSKYPVFQADDDNGLPDAMNELSANYLAMQVAAEQRVEHRKAVRKTIRRRTLYNPVVLLVQELFDGGIPEYQEKAKAFERAVRWFETANERWKWSIGAYSKDRYIEKTVQYKCYCEGTWLELFTPYSTKSWQDCNNYVSSQCRRSKGVIEPITKKTYLEQPTDGIVPMSSAIAFPGVEPNNVYLLDGSNHQQMRNDSNTKDGLRRVFSGKFGPFFMLDKR